MEDHESLDKFIEEAKGRQRNIVFPDTVRNERAAWVFLWKGSPEPTVVQRIAAWLFGLLFLGNGLIFLGMAASAHNGDSWILVPLSMPFIFVGVRMVRNGFPKHHKPAPNSN
jgi:hypothetical protein